MRELESDPEWVARRTERELRHREREQRLREDEAPILDELQAVGVQVSSVYDFLKQGAPPAAAVPILVRHLRVSHLPAIREGVIRALTYPHVRESALQSLIEEFERESDPALRWVIANALSAMTTLEELDNLRDIQEFSELFK